MVLTPCAACNCIPGNELEQTWRQNVRITLCDIASGVAPIAASVVQLPQTTVAFGALPAAYAAISFLDAENAISEMYVSNNSDADIEISLDGGNTTHYRVLANSGRSISFGGKTHVGTTDLFIQYASGFTPSTGNVYFEGSYS